MQTSCQTCPENQGELVKNLDPGYFPQILNITNYSGIQKRELIFFFTSVYTEHMKLLLSARSTGRFIDDIEIEIYDCQEVLDWLETIKPDQIENELLD